jgi:hypothetical protein
MIQADRMKFVTEVREKLCQSGFYNHDKLELLASMFKEDSIFGKLISSYSISATGTELYLQFRKQYTDTPVDIYQDNHFNCILSRFYMNQKFELMSIIGIDNIQRFLNMDVSMYYFITRFNIDTGNMVVIRFA